jgi:hypothetical protein
MHTPKHTIAISTCGNTWAWSLFDRDEGLIESGVAQDHVDAMTKGWSAARKITPASSRIYPEIQLLQQESRSFSEW